MKTRYYGAQAYDFSESGLIATAQPLTQTRTDEAIKFLNMNIDLFPRSARTYVALAGAQQVKKDTAGAIASLEKALQIEPNNAGAKRMLAELKKQQPLVFALRPARGRPLGQAVAQRGARDTKPSRSCQSSRSTLYTTPSMS